MAVKRDVLRAPLTFTLDHQLSRRLHHMRRWERRLKDLSMSLEACGAGYFEPERFRFNANHFLTTARTVSFLFQKDKASIEDFDTWHLNNIYNPWHADTIMKWSITSRNTIEKEGDLNLHSTVNATLIFGYIEEQDVAISLEKQTHLNASIKRLIRFARFKLPSGVSDTAVVRVDRRWVANTLPEFELLQAFRYIYTRMYEACESLAKHLHASLESSIPEPTSFDEVSTGSRGTHYIPLNSTLIHTIAAQRYAIDKNFIPPPWLKKISEDKELTPPNSLYALMEFHKKMAHANFTAFGNHLAMLWLYNEKFEPINMIGTAPKDQAAKFIFWRTVSDRIHYLKAKYLIWVSEAWIRKGIDKQMRTPIRNLPIIGELLQVVGMGGGDQYIKATWDIKRENQESAPTLALQPPPERYDEEEANYLIPARRALNKVNNSCAKKV